MVPARPGWQSSLTAADGGGRRAAHTAGPGASIPARVNAAEVKPGTALLPHALSTYTANSASPEASLAVCILRRDMHKLRFICPTFPVFTVGFRPVLQFAVKQGQGE